MPMKLMIAFGALVAAAGLAACVAAGDLATGPTCRDIYFPGRENPESLCRTQAEWAAFEATPAEDGSMLVCARVDRVYGGRFGRACATEARMAQLKQAERANTQSYVQTIQGSKY